MVQLSEVPIAGRRLPFLATIRYLTAGVSDLSLVAFPTSKRPPLRGKGPAQSFYRSFGWIQGWGNDSRCGQVGSEL